VKTRESNTENVVKLPRKERKKREIQMNGSRSGRSSNKKHQAANVLNGFGGRLVNEDTRFQSPPTVD
jgi:hypothetical protein